MIAQLNLGSNSLRKMEVVSMLNINNTSHYIFHYNSTWGTTKYNPRIYFGSHSTYSTGWNYEIHHNGIGISPTNLTWPESMVKNITLLRSTEYPHL